MVLPGTVLPLLHTDAAGAAGCTGAGGAAGAAGGLVAVQGPRPAVIVYAIILCISVCYLNCSSVQWLACVNSGCWW
jgi:hypothetical protein